MIYFDNAATTLIKPKEVERNFIQALHNLGNSGRGAHSSTLDASRIIFDTREKLQSLFNLPNSNNISFTNNATESLNIGIRGFINPGDHVITSVCEHNSVLRPLYLKEEGENVEISFLETLQNTQDEKSMGILNYDQLEGMIKENTKAIIITHASNLTGNITDIERVSEICKKHKLTLFVDGSQSAGDIEVNVEKLGIDIFCFTGHKGLLGPQGTGGIFVRDGVEIRPLKVGGSGVHSFDKVHPENMPERLEAGTLNGHGIAGLNGSLEYIINYKIDNIRKKEMALTKQFIDGVKDIPGLVLYGNPDLNKRVAIVSLNIKDLDSSQVSDQLAYKYGIATRGGAHCAPLMHRALGTEKQGAVRFSFSHYNTEEEVNLAIKAIKELSL